MGEAAADVPHEAGGEGDQLLRDAALVHHFARDHEQERRDQQVVVGPAEGDQPDDLRHHRRVEQDHRRGGDAEDEGDGQPRDQQDDEKDQDDPAGIEKHHASLSGKRSSGSTWPVRRPARRVRLMSAISAPPTGMA
jgi:hypothetical protein